ncbi:hypothetical protein GGR50DRAFT_22668 [Xylaria sp. CBS 124048]|nr:hypothetical protein GGR50DRAFT_22668 [Xylaria sp. CBS 124048]
MASPSTPKTMSSRLLTMKFMQRAAASNPSSSPPTPSTVASNDSNKRRKVSHDTTPQPNVDTLVNQAAVRAAIAEEEKKAERAKLKRAEELGDAHWVLDIPQQPHEHAAQSRMKVVRVGLAQIDSMDSEDSESESADATHSSIPAIRRFNMNKKKAKKTKVPKKSEHSNESSSDSNLDASYLSSSSSSDDDDEISGPQPLDSQSSPRRATKGKLTDEKSKATQLAEKRRKKDVKLNSPKGGMTSISAGGAPPPRQFVNLTCYNCGQAGHKSIDCKSPRKRWAR